MLLESGLASAPLPGEFRLVTTVLTARGRRLTRSLHRYLVIRYTASWSVTGKRIKIGSKAAGWISETTYSTSAVTQANVNSCAQKCTSTSNCVTANVIQYSGGSGAKVVCELYSQSKAQSEATYTARMDGSGRVVASYNYSKNKSGGATTITVTAPPKTSTTTTSTKTSSTVTSSSTSTKASSSTSTKTSTTTTSSSSSSSVTTTSTAQAGVSTDGPRSKNKFPSPPSGATFYQYRPSACTGTSAYVPLFANQHWVNSTKPTSTARRAYIVQHGMGRDFQNAFNAISPNVDQSEAVILTPNFYLTSDTPTVTNGAQSNWFDPSFNLAWSETNAWVGGSDAVGPSSTAGSCSTYEIWDSLVAKLSDKTAFPLLDTIYLVGHSGGGSFMLHYAPVHKFSTSATTKWVAMNAAAFPYYDSARPSSYSDCASSYNSWIYGWGGSLPRYVSGAGGSNPISLFKRFAQLDFSLGEGTNDIRRLYNYGDSSCGVLAQGGLNRRDRNYAWWAYVNLLGGTSADVSQYYGYANLQKSVTPVGNNGFNLRNCVVTGVGHVDEDMYKSVCGQYYLGQSSTAPSAEPPVQSPS